MKILNVISTRSFFFLTINNIIYGLKEGKLLFYIKCEIELLKLRNKFYKSRKRLNKHVLLYPGFPSCGFVLYKVLRILGCRLYNSYDKECDLAIDWRLYTLRSKNDALKKIAKNRVVINEKCLDISKQRVDFIFRKIFGYSSFIDPLTYDGSCVVKSDCNATHDGRIIRCPIKTKDDTKVYQKVINNQIDDQYVLDVRVPIIGKNIPFVYFKYRLITKRFTDIQKATIKETKDIFSEEEIANIYYFCQEIGLDYGELDVLKDNPDGKIYIIDANTTPFGPSFLSSQDWTQAVLRLSESFYKQFF